DPAVHGLLLALRAALAGDARDRRGVRPGGGRARRGAARPGCGRRRGARPGGAAARGGVMARLAVVGMGKMGEALVRGLTAAGWSADDVVVTDVRREHLRGVADRLGVGVADGNEDAASRA